MDKCSDNKKRILFIVPSMVGGGVERCLLNMINAMDPQKYEVDIVAIKSGGDLVRQIPGWVTYRYIWKREWRIAGKRIPGSDKFFSFIFCKFSPQLLYKTFIRKKYDVGIDYWGQEGLNLVVGINKNAKKLVFIHSDMNSEGLKKAFFPFRDHESLKSAYSEADYIIGVSEDCKKSMIDRFVFPKDSEKLIVRYNINLNEKIICKGEENILNQVDRSKVNGKILCAVGRLTKIKGYDRLIKICAHLKTDKIAFQLWLLGQGEERCNLESLIKEYDISDCVKLLGFQSNPYPYMKNADVFVCSSFFEGFSTVVSEAVILGVPVVTTNCTGAKEILGESEYGIVSGLDDESLYMALKSILTDEGLYQHYLDKVKERQSFFDKDKRLKEIEDLFD